MRTNYETLPDCEFVDPCTLGLELVLDEFAVLGIGEDNSLREKVNSPDRLKLLGRNAVSCNTSFDLVGTIPDTGIETAWDRLQEVNQDEKARCRANSALEQLGIGQTVFAQWAEAIDYKLDSRGVRDWLGAITGFSDEQLMNFFQWNVEVTLRAQKALDALLPDFRERMPGYVQQLVQNGIFPGTALKRLERLDKHKFTAGDVFDTDVEARNGYHCRGEKKITVSPLLLLDNPDAGYLEEVLIHESLHAMTVSEKLRSKSIAWDEGLIQKATNMILLQTSSKLLYFSDSYFKEVSVLEWAIAKQGESLRALKPFYDIMFDSNPKSVRRKYQQLCRKYPCFEPIYQTYPEDSENDEEVNSWYKNSIQIIKDLSGLSQNESKDYIRDNKLRPTNKLLAIAQASIRASMNGLLKTALLVSQEEEL